MLSDARPTLRRMAAPKPDVEAMLDRIGSLVAERQRLRATGASAAELEENRRLLAGAQWELARALIELHRPRRRRAA
jgi:hypothetical protein